MAIPTLPPGGASEADTLAAGSTGSRPPSSGASLDGGRFTPGVILEARYRIVGLLGRGGMGEVYRAEDLRLGETVALKFLPEKLTRDGAALARFHREVRTARLITHRNVVRVHDLGEIGGQPYLSMEFVGGEDLASLLHRIGRLPQDKAIELGRQLAAGLAAAHERGILHRDLKPGNILIDAQGRAKITDFGLAALASELESPELAGTPAYMAPEQLGEGRVSFQSDLYSLGLVLFEMLSGKRPFAGEARSEVLERLHYSDPPRLSGHVSGLDPRLEELVLRCLAPKPERRPSSAMEVAAALPGGDPLAEALAAGETPSPEMVARAREAGTLARPKAVALLGTFLVGLAVFFVVDRGTTVVDVVPPLEPEVLIHQAQRALASAGFEGSHDAWDFEISGWGALASERRLDLAGWRALAAQRPGFVELLYRQGRSPLQSQVRFNWRVTDNDPPLTTPGTATVRVDGQGRLVSLLVVPPEATGVPAASGITAAAAASAADEAATAGIDFEPASGPAASDAAEPDWSPFFAAAELDPSSFAPTEPVRPPLLWADRLRAWRGTYPGQTEPPILVEAAARGDRVLQWRVSELPLRQPPQLLQLPAIAFMAFALLWVGASILARRHLKTAAGDRQGALRLAIVVAVAAFAGPLLLAHHTRSASAELLMVFAALGQGAMFGASAWLLYMALEPYARRVAPRWMVSWTRLLAGRFRDPMVGRDLLTGLATGAALYAVLEVLRRLQLELGPGPLRFAFEHELGPLRGALPTISNVLHPVTLIVPFGLMAVMVATRALLRRPWPAFVAAAIVIAAFDIAVTGLHPHTVLRGLVVIAVGARWGLLALAALSFFIVNLSLVPASADPALWWSASSWLGWAPVVALACYAYRIATQEPGTRRFSR